MEKDKPQYTSHKYKYLSSQISLRTTDEAITKTLLTKHVCDESKTNVNFVHKQNDPILASLTNVLTENECNEIMSNCDGDKSLKFQKMNNNKYDEYTRKSDRLLIIDKELSNLLYNRLNDLIKNEIISKHNVSCMPLGFGVLNNNKWEITSINNGMRINRYSSNDNDFFAHHKDGQYCNTSHQRSLFTLIIYLNDDFDGGETKFYFETKQIQRDSNGMTIQEEIASNGGIKNGYKCITIKPQQCNGVLFSQNLLHEACKILNKNKYKFVLKTDIIVSRKNECIGFAISSQESLDYKRCLNYFIEAQQNELNGNKTKANELYERSLSIRYSYPKKLLHSQKKIIKNKLCIDIAEIWMIIFGYCYYREIECCSYLFPNELYATYLQFKLMNDNRENYYAINDKTHRFVPKVVSKYGMYIIFALEDLKFYEENINACLRVAAIYAFYLMSHFKKSKYFIVEYNSFTQNIIAVTLNKLLTDVFYNRQCHGKYFKIQTGIQAKIEVDEQEDDESVSSDISEMDEVFDNEEVLNNQQDISDYINDHSVLHDIFNKNIDRDYMTIHHGAQFLGGVGLLTENHKFGVSVTKKFEHSENESDIWLPNGKSYYGARAEPKKLLDNMSEHLWSFLMNNDYDDNNLLDGIYGTHTFDKTVNKQNYFNDIKNNKISMNKTRITCGYNDKCKRKFGTKMYNHLIFDFEKNSLDVIENKQIYDDEECKLCFEYNFEGHIEDLILQHTVSPEFEQVRLNERYEEYMNEMKKHIKYYIVDIKNILNNDGGFDISYNHAGGTCCSVCDVHVYGNNGYYTCPNWDDFECSVYSGCARMKHVHIATIKDVQKNTLFMSVSYNPMNAM